MTRDTNIEIHPINDKKNVKGPSSRLLIAPIIERTHKEEPISCPLTKHRKH